MNIIIGKHSGFCFGVKNAVEAAQSNECKNAYSLGHIIHNKQVIEQLVKNGVKTVDSIEDIPDGATAIIRSHGESRETYEKLKAKGCKIVDATCPFVKKIHDKIVEYDQKGYQVVIIGKREHPEVKASAGWSKNVLVLDSESDVDLLEKFDKICVVVQTTYSIEKYNSITKKITEKIIKCHRKTVEIFNTICYTTNERQTDAQSLACNCDAVIVVGDKTSSNTKELFAMAKRANNRTYFAESVSDIANVKFLPTDKIGLIGGASTPYESIMEVKRYMDQKDDVNFKDSIDELKGSDFMSTPRNGQTVTGNVISANEKGIQLSLGNKFDGFIAASEVCLEGEYRPEDYQSGMKVAAVVLGKKDESGCVPLSKKRADLQKEKDKEVEVIRDGNTTFELTVESMTKGGLLSHIGSYRVFIPASQVKTHYVSDLGKFVGKTLRLRVLDIDDANHKIVASQRVILEKEQAERAEKEEVFWDNVHPDVVVAGEVKRINDYGAFVSVDGIDCLAHKEHLSWSHIDSPSEVLEIGKTYEFLVLRTDREKKRVSLGYKELQPHPFDECMVNNPVGSVVKGKVISVLPYGAFVEIMPGVEGLVHVSEASSEYVKNIEEILHKGDEVTVKIMSYDPDNRKTTLSIKACLPETPADSAKAPSEKKRGSKKSDDSQDAYKEDVANNPLAGLLKDMEDKK